MIRAGDQEAIILPDSSKQGGGGGKSTVPPEISDLLLRRGTIFRK